MEKLFLIDNHKEGNFEDLSKNISPSILPVNFKGIISHILDKFPESTEVVISSGYLDDTLKNYLDHCYPERKFTFEKFEGEGSIKRRLLSCKRYLEGPFTIITTNILPMEDIPTLSENWTGLSTDVEEDIFIAGIKDQEIFWKELESLSLEEELNFSKVRSINISPRNIVFHKIKSKEDYIKSNEKMNEKLEAFDFGKNDEFLYFVNKRVIKFFANEDAAKKRAERSLDLKGLCPEIENYKSNFYSYKKVPGSTLYEVMNPQKVKSLLYWADENLWERRDNLSPQEFKDLCKKFYYDKTMKRLEDFYKINNMSDKPSIINGIHVPTLKEILNKLNWEEIFDGIQTRFHGDFTVGNILVSYNDMTGLEDFILLDWRHEFAGSTKVGDLYYDLAKLYKGIFLSDDLIKKNMFSFERRGENIYYEYNHTRRLNEAREEFDNFLDKSDYDKKKVQIISSICLLNMSPLHHYPFNFLCYYLGKGMLYKLLYDR